jgi:hypothetical protein
MDLVEKLSALVERLRQEKVKFALAGGLASSIYRKTKRSTDDIDLLIFAEIDSEKLARRILKDFSLNVLEARKASLEGGPKHLVKSKRSPTYILIGRREGQIGIDFILPEIPWFERAIERAQSNQLKFGDLVIPCLTVEDVLVSKFYSLANDSTRFSDADDIKVIFQSQSNIDLGYLAAQMLALRIGVPLSVEKLVPAQILRVSKKLKKAFLNPAK